MIYLKMLSVLQFLARFSGGNHGGNFFMLQNGNKLKGGGNQQSLTNFHLCSLSNNCSDIAEDKVTGKLKQITGIEERDEAFKNNKLIWKKMPGLKSLYFSCLYLGTGHRKTFFVKSLIISE